MKKLSENLLEIMLAMGTVILSAGLFLKYGVEIALIVVGGGMATLSTILIFIAIFQPTRGGK